MKTSRNDYFIFRPPKQQLGVKASEMSFSSCKHQCLTKKYAPPCEEVLNSKDCL